LCKGVMTVAVMVCLEFALVPAQALFDPLRGCLEGCQGIVGLAIGLQRRTRVQVKLAVRTVPRSRLFHGDLARISSVEIFGYGFLHLLFNTLAEAVADFHMFTGHTHTHGGYLSFMICVHQSIPTS